MAVVVSCDASAPGEVASPVDVLIAEENDDMRELLVTSLRRAGVTVAVAASAAELERAWGTRALPSPRVAILDTSAHDIGVLPWLRRRDPRVRVILITAFGDDVTLRRARHLGAAAVVDKPFDFNELVELVTVLLQVEGDDPPAVAP